MSKKQWSWPLFFLVVWVASSFISPNALAQRRRAEIRPHRRAAVLVNLPHEHVRMLVGGREFFYSRGVFYRTGPRGYVTIAAPIGARIKVLPEGFSSVTIGGAPFFLYYGTYYKYDPVEKVYVVANPPAPDASHAPPALDRLDLVDGTSVDGIFIGGTKNTIQFQTNGDVQEYPIEQVVTITFAPPQQN
jgi:hypothetical protein